jgi:hypothetical protein
MLLGILALKRVAPLSFFYYLMPHNKGPCGHPSWVVGTKLTFLSQYSADWLKATNISLVATGKFYTKVTKCFIKKYGWYFDCWTDKEYLDPDP